MGTSAPRLTGWAWLSIAAALSTMVLKLGAFAVTGSVGLLSDGLESLVNLVAAAGALLALTVAARPPDDSHRFGHGKAEYFSAGAEGLMILVAAVAIIVSAVGRLLDPQPLADLGIGLMIVAVATIINGVVGSLLLRAGRIHRSITLRADGQHLLTDVWTSLGVIVGVGLVGITGWLPLDALVAIAVALNILWTGARLVQRSTRGLMDHALPDADEATVRAVLQRFVDAAAPGELEFHAVRTREAGRARFVTMHVIVPGEWTVVRGHDLVEQVECALRDALPDVDVHTHLEPREDPRAYEDNPGGVRIARD